MTREQAERLVASGGARWEGSTLVLLRCGPPLMYRGAPVVCDTPSEPSRVTWPGKRRSPDGVWSDG